MQNNNEWYLFNLQNVANYIKNKNKEDNEGTTAFTLLEGVSVAWAKSYDSVMKDYLEIVLKNKGDDLNESA